jgi:hypothetical protein
MVATQKIHIGMIHARKIVTVTAGDHSFRISIDGDTVGTVPRTTDRERATATRPARLSKRQRTGLSHAEGVNRDRPAH